MNKLNKLDKLNKLEPCEQADRQLQCDQPDRKNDYDRYDLAILKLKQKHQYRSLVVSSASSKDFSSNDYLGLATDSELRNQVAQFLQTEKQQEQTQHSAEQRGVGAGASRLLRGNWRIHEQCEKAASQFFGGERSLYFSSGFLANFSIMTTLVHRSDVVFYDEEIHASLKEGIHASKARRVKFRHNDLEDLEKSIHRILKREQALPKGSSPSPCYWLVLEALYSMSGMLVDIEAMIHLAKKYDLFLVLDEAHSSGIFSGGRGLLWPHLQKMQTAPYGTHTKHIQHREVRFLSVHTCGKAWGGSGALVCGDQQIIEVLINRARPFIYSTGISPVFAFCMIWAMRTMQESPERLQRHAELTQLANDLIAQKVGIKSSGTHIIPIVLGENARTLRASGNLQREGFDVRAIRPPTVKKGTARLRISITLNVEEKDVCDMVACLQKSLC